MKVKLYVNWNDGQILTETELNAQVENSAKQMSADGSKFAEWLCEMYTAFDAFYFTEVDKENVFQQWMECCRERVYAESIKCFKPIDKEI